MANVKRKSLINSPIMERPGPNFSSPLLRGRQSLVGSEVVSEINEIIDEAAEIKKRQIERVAEVMQTNMVSSPITPNERRTSIHLSNFTTKNLMDHYAECIRLSTENKITTRNAFSLHLIDYMAEMFNNKDATDFQLASSTLDASAKIYSCRVDIIHSEMYKLLTGLGRGWNKNEAVNDDVDGRQDDMNIENEDGQKKSGFESKKRKAKHGKTIETNLKNITLNKNDQLNALDPIIAKTINDFNIGSCGGILLNQLHMYLDLPELYILPTSIVKIRESYARPKKKKVPTATLR